VTPVLISWVKLDYTRIIIINLSNYFKKTIYFLHLLAVITTPSGKKQFPKIEDNKNGTVKISYQPTEVGLHQMDVLYNKNPVQGSPFSFYVDAISVGHVTAYGPGLSYGIAGQPCHFTIVTKDAGAGSLPIIVLLGY